MYYIRESIQKKHDGEVLCSTIKYITNDFVPLGAQRKGDRKEIIDIILVYIFCFLSWTVRIYIGRDAVLVFCSFPFLFFQSDISGFSQWIQV